MICFECMFIVHLNPKQHVLNIYLVVGIGLINEEITYEKRVVQQNVGIT